MQASEEIETRIRIEISIDASHASCAPCDRPAAMQATARVYTFMWICASSRPDCLPRRRLCRLHTQLTAIPGAQ